MRAIVFAIAAALAAAVTGATEGSAEAASDVPTQDAPSRGQVVIDRVAFEGDHDVRDELLTSAVDVPVGVALSREELDQRLERARQRLVALGYFKTVDLRLAKGRERGHFELTVTLEAQRSSYVGMSYQRNRKSEGTGDQRGLENGDLQQIFAGTRNLAGTGLRSELGLWRSEARRDEDGGERDRSLFSAAQVSLYEPSIADSPWFAGATLGYFDTRYKYRYKDDRSASFGAYRSALVAAGRRFGLASASVGFFRLGGRSRWTSNRYDDETNDWFYSRLTTQLRYSEKSFLTAVEPGAVLALVYDRDVAPEWQPPATTASALYTVTLPAAQALTPTGILRHTYYRMCRNDGCSTRLRRSYDLGLTYEVVFANQVILGLTYGQAAVLAADRGPFKEDDKPLKRWRASTTYNANGLILELAFLYGDPGLDSSQLEFVFPDHSRFTQ